ncbi:hypothetical protein ZWY2020_003007 [Hordeum vulgare]|nr:hypothetical protein ZWY2020_003007 [Hordeum vulgare]
MIDYTTVVGIATGNKYVAVRYVPLMLAGSARTWLNSLPAGSINSWVYFEEAFVCNFTGTYKRPGRPREVAMCIQKPDEPLRDYVTWWTELRNSCEGVHEVQAIQYFIDGCRDATLLKHKLMCSEPTSLVVLMAKADKYATADSVMRVKMTASDKAVPTPATPKPAGDNRGGQNNNKRKADQMDSRSNIKLVANVEGATSAPQDDPPRKRSNRNNANWLPRQSFEQLLDAPCKIHSGAQPSGHTLRQCSFMRRLSQGDDLPAPPRARAAPRAPAPRPAPAPPPPPHDDGHLHDDYPHQDGAFVVFTSEGDDKHNLRQRRREVNATVPPVPQYMHWSHKPITCSRVDHPTVMPNPGSYALVLDPTFTSKRLTCRFSRVLVDGRSSINILYLNTLLKLGLKETDVLPTSTVFHGIVPGQSCSPIGKI